MTLDRARRNEILCSPELYFKSIPILDKQQWNRFPDVMLGERQEFVKQSCSGTRGRAKATVETQGHPAPGTLSTQNLRFQLRYNTHCIRLVSRNQWTIKLHVSVLSSELEITLKCLIVQTEAQEPKRQWAQTEAQVGQDIHCKNWWKLPWVTWIDFSYFTVIVILDFTPRSKDQEMGMLIVCNKTNLCKAK